MTHPTDPVERFRLIMLEHEDFIIPVPPMRLVSISANDCEVRTVHRAHSYEVADFAANETGSGGWIIRLESPTKDGQEYVWKLTKG